jgi:hypothetical protein
MWIFSDLSVITNPLELKSTTWKGYAYVYLYRPYVYTFALNYKVEYNGASLVNLKLKVIICIRWRQTKYIKIIGFIIVKLYWKSMQRRRNILFEVRMNQKTNPGIQFQQCQMAWVYLLTT